jgi:hypothetical protein
VFRNARHRRTALPDYLMAACPGKISGVLETKAGLTSALFERCQQAYWSGFFVNRHAPGLSQSEITGNEEHHNNDTHDVKNIVHVSFSFLLRNRTTVDPGAHNITRKGAG